MADVITTQGASELENCDHIDYDICLMLQIHLNSNICEKLFYFCLVILWWFGVDLGWNDPTKTILPARTVMIRNYVLEIECTNNTCSLAYYH